jgi:hypothetical protein
MIKLFNLSISSRISSFCSEFHGLNSKISSLILSLKSLKKSGSLGGVFRRRVDFLTGSPFSDAQFDISSKELKSELLNSPDSFGKSFFLDIICF